MIKFGHSFLINIYKGIYRGFYKPILIWVFLPFFLPVHMHLATDQDRACITNAFLDFCADKDKDARKENKIRTSKR